jgi:hypothetical protein
MKKSKKCDCEGHDHKCSCGHCDCEAEQAYKAEDGKAYRSVKLGSPKKSGKTDDSSAPMDEATKALMRGMGFNI